jgi:peptidoglycan hydrolase-like protein with peptidoglycan-binding domain
MEILGLAEAALWEVELTGLAPTCDLSWIRWLSSLIKHQSPRFLSLVLGAFVAVVSPVFVPVGEVFMPAKAIAATTTCGTTVLREGAEGAAVRQLQTLLVKAGYPVSVDGIFGEGTAIALKSFQRKAQLDPDGVYGAKTCAALTKATTSTSGGSASGTTANPKPATTGASSATASGATAAITGGTTNLLRGNEGDAVFKLQDQLRRLGYTNVGLTGRFDEATDKAVRHFQQMKGLTVDGIVGTNTQAKINGAIANGEKYSLPATPAPAPVPVPAPIPAPTPVPRAQSNQARYIVAVPSRSSTTLADVKRIIPKAVLSDSRRGIYVYAGSYSNREAAESASYSLRSYGLDARVITE